MQPSDSSPLPRRLHLIDFPSWPSTAKAGLGEVRSPRFRHLRFMRNGVSDHGRAVTPCIAVHNVLPSTFSTASASATLNLSRLNIPLHMIAVHASRPSSPAAPQHSLDGGSLLPYPHRTLTGWKAPASPGALRLLSGMLANGRRLARPRAGTRSKAERAPRLARGNRPAPPARMARTMNTTSIPSSMAIWKLARAAAKSQPVDDSTSWQAMTC